MKSFKLTLFLFTIWWSISIISASVQNNSTLELQTTHRGTTNNRNADKHVTNMTSDTVDYSQDFFNTEELNKICHNQINEFIWKCPSENEEKLLKFRTIESDGQQTDPSILNWYLKSINKINIVEMNPRSWMHQIQFIVNIDKGKIILDRLYPTFPEISGFEILQFLTQLAFQCNFFIYVFDASDISKIYSALYGTHYYEYHFKGVKNLSHYQFLFKNIIIEKKTFLTCFEENIKGVIKNLSQFFYENIQLCENIFVSVEFCPISFDTHYIFYSKSFQHCIDWPSIGGFPKKFGNSPISQRFEILSKDINRIMKKQKHYVNFVHINPGSDKKIIKTYEEIKTQILDTSFLMKLFSTIFELCFFELEKQKYEPNPEDIFKLYLRPCIIPNINLFLKYDPIV